MKSNWKAPILAAFGLMALAVAIPVGVANAQQNDQAAGQRSEQRTQGGPPQNFQGGPPQGFQPEMAQRMGMMGGGQATMVTDNAFLFVLQGNMLYKINKNTLEVVAQGSLPMPGPRGDMPGGPGAPGFRSGGAAGAGGQTRGGGGGETAPDTAK